MTIQGLMTTCVPLCDMCNAAKLTQKLLRCMDLSASYIAFTLNECNYIDLPECSLSRPLSSVAFSSEVVSVSGSVGISFGSSFGQQIHLNDKITENM